MTPDALDRFCATLPGATREMPFGPDTVTWKLGGKIFAVYSDDWGGVSVKCKDADTAAFLIEIGAARPAPYLKRGGWVQLVWDTDGAEVRERVQTSYDVIWSKLTRAVRAQITAAQ